MPKPTEAPKRVVDPKRERLRRTVRYFYDVQKLRIAAGNRTADPDAFKLVPDGQGGEKKVKKNVSKKSMDTALAAVLESLRGNMENDQPPDDDDGKEKPAPPTLEEEDRLYLNRQNLVLHSLEADTLKRIEEMLKDIPIATWIREQRGIGVTLTAVLISEIDITRCDTPSALWAYAGLHTDAATGQAVRLKRGVKANWNSFLKTKVVKILADCFIKANSPWRLHYDNYKQRKKNELVQTCMLCAGSGKARAEEDEDDTTKPLKKCTRCDGTGGPAPWGRSDAHRDMASKRYMVKMFLLELWTRWRTLEGLPIRESYAEAVLGRRHGDHQGAGAREFRPAPRSNPRSPEQFKQLSRGD